MPTPTRRDPRYRHYKPKDLAVVRIAGRDHYLGRYGTPESWERYHKLLAEHHARGGMSPPPSATPGRAQPQDGLTINELIMRYFRHAEKYYVKDGQPTHQVVVIRQSLKVLRSLYGSAPVADFSPPCLKACRAAILRQPSPKSGLTLCRNEVNRRTRLIVQAFRWGTAEGLVPPDVYHGLQAVEGLKAGRCSAPDLPPVGPVAEAVVERTLSHLTPMLAAMVRLQLASAMRPGELVILRACDLNMSGPIWEYRPATHKMQHHRKAKVIMIGPRGQEIIRPFLALDISGYLFRPQRANARRDRYDVGEYHRAIGRACDRAFPHPELSAIRQQDLTAEQRVEMRAWQKAHRWAPNQLRLTGATAIRGRYGAEAAQAVLGHADLKTTEIYAEKSLETARRIMGEVG
jgi:integrase